MLLIRNLRAKSDQLVEHNFLYRPMTRKKSVGRDRLEGDYGLIKTHDASIKLQLHAGDKQIIEKNKKT